MATRGDINPRADQPRMTESQLRQGSVAPNITVRQNNPSYGTRMSGRSNRSSKRG